MRSKAAEAVRANALPLKGFTVGGAERGSLRTPLDNAANLFSAIASKRATSVFRFSVRLRETVDPGVLQQALDRILPGFTPFNVRMRSGLFWRCFEENNTPAPRVQKEQTSPCRFIRTDENNGYLFRILYDQRLIHLEAFHVLTDGMGAIAFLKALVFQYLRLRHPALAEACGDAPASALDCEESFLKYFKKTMAGRYAVERAFLIDGKKRPCGTLGVTHGYLDLPQLKRLCRRLGLTVNEYLVSVYVWSIYTEYLHGAPSARPIRIAVPVNLRTYFPSATLRNFFAIISAEFRPEREQYCFEEVCRIVQKSLQQQLRPEHLREVFSYSVTCQVHPVLKWIPLPLKQVLLRFAFRRAALANTSTVSNVGIIEVEELYRPYIEQFNVFMPVSKGQHIKGTFCSYEDTLVFTFSYDLAQPALESGFFQKLAEDGLSVRVESSGRDEA